MIETYAREVNVRERDRETPRETQQERDVYEKERERERLGEPETMKPSLNRVSSER